MTKSLIIPHIYSRPLIFLWHIPFALSLSHLTFLCQIYPSLPLLSPPIHSLSNSEKYISLFLTHPSIMSVSFLPFTPRPLGAGGFFSFQSAEPSRSQTETQKEKRVCLWCACTCMAAPPSSSGPPSSLSLLPQMSLEEADSPLLSSSSSCYLWCYSGTTGAMEGRENNVLSSSLLHLFNYLLHPSVFF